MEQIEKYFDLNDPSKKGPRGFVFAYDETGKLLFAKENMIVQSGRSKMMKYGFDTNGSRITKIILGDNEEITEPSFNDISCMKRKS